MDEVQLKEKSCWAALFPGQGSQGIGMLASLAEQYPCVLEIFEQGSSVLGYDIWSLAQNGTTEEIGKTQVTQPLMLLAGLAVWQVWVSQYDLRPDFVAGHSLGEYSALVASGAIKLKDAVKVVQTRARLMQETVPDGAGMMMVVLGLSDERVLELCQEVSPEGAVSPANFNAPGQVVVGGLTEAVERFAKAAKASGCKRVLPVAMSVPSHCALLKPAAQQLASSLDALEIVTPLMPVVNNVHAQPEKDIEKIRLALKQQIYSPVMWSHSVKALSSLGCRQFVEFGPKKVLTGLGKRIDSGVQHMGIETAEELMAAYKSLVETVDA